MMPCDATTVAVAFAVVGPVAVAAVFAVVDAVADNFYEYTVAVIIGTY